MGLVASLLGVFINRKLGAAFCEDKAQECYVDPGKGVILADAIVRKEEAHPQFQYRKRYNNRHM